MKIRSLQVDGLNERTSARYVFHDDINIITGLNGSGKTTLLKLVWYLISGNAERIAPEMSYESIELRTDLYEISLRNNDSIVSWSFAASGKNKIFGEHGVSEANKPRGGIEDLNRLVMKVESQSQYFPTFRRIEGGYSISSSRRIRRYPEGSLYAASELSEIQHEMDNFSRRLSVNEHQFICSISTNDIVLLLTKKYAAISESLNAEYKDFSTSIIKIIEGAKSKNEEEIDSSALDILNELQGKADEINERREQYLKPFSVLSELTAKLFRHRGIKVRGVTLGDSIDAIDSAALSAGEKQMLSFLCYNAFSSNSVVFIDEPELSLHPDWQRRLFPTLMKQQPKNQFIVATHSPFIYSKYEDKEILVGDERGE